MKQVILLLVVANLLVFGWQLMRPDEPGSAATPELTMPPGVEPLRLLAEEGAASPSATADEAEFAPVTVDQSTELLPNDNVPRCHVIGPFDEALPAEQFGGSLTRFGARPTVREEALREDAGYWVFLPEQPADQARATLEKLREKGVKDYYLGKTHYISLGIYSNKEAAERRLTEIAEMGFEPVVERRFRTHTVYWLDVREPGPDFIGEEEWSELLAASPGLEHNRIACP